MEGDPRLEALNALVRAPLFAGQSLESVTQVGGRSLWPYFHEEFLYEGVYALDLMQGGRPRRSPLRKLGHWPFVLDALLALLSAGRRRLHESPHLGEAQSRPHILVNSLPMYWNPEQDLQDVQRAESNFGPLVARLTSGDARAVYAFMQGSLFPLPPSRREAKAARRRATGRIPVLPLESLWDDEATRTARAARRELRSAWRKVTAGWPEARNEVMRHTHLAAHDLERLRSSLHYGFRVIMPLYAGLETACRKAVGPHTRLLLLTNETGRTERCLIACAAELGIPSVGVQHGALISDHPGYKQPPGGQGPRVLPTCTAVYGRMYEQMFQRDFHYQPGQVRAVGHPRSDTTHQLRETARAKVRSSLGLQPEASMALFIGQYRAWSMQERAAAQRFVEDLARLPGHQVLVRPHPLDLPTQVPRLPPGVQLVDPASDLLPWLRAVDVVIVRNSTVGLEAMLMGTPVIVLDLANDEDVLGMVRAGAAPVIRDAAGFLPAFAEARGADGAARAYEFACERLGVPDGLAMDRLERLCVELALPRPSRPGS